jgi:hypothetical protein
MLVAPADSPMAGARRLWHADCFLPGEGGYAMRRVAVGMVATASFMLFAPAAGHAAALKLSLVQAYAPCLAPNAVHPVPPGSDACAPAEPLSAYRLPRGRSMIRVNTNAGALRVKVSLRGVRGPDDSPYSGFGLTARVILRLTDAHCAAGPCTVEDAEFDIPLTCAAGWCVRNASPFPLARDRVALEVVRIEVRDDTESVLAVPGLVP